MAATNTITANPITQNLTANDLNQGNPGSILGKDDFLKLLLVELQYQDPTEPMDSGKILEQTSQLAALESQENTNKALEKLGSSFSQTQDLQAVSAIGKHAVISDSVIDYSGSGGSQFDVYYDNPVKSGTLEIKDTLGNTVKSFNLNQASQAGTMSFSWDGKDAAGTTLGAGRYTIQSNYIDADGAAQEAKYGTYLVSAVSFDQGNVKFKVGEQYLDMAQVKEIY